MRRRRPRCQVIGCLEPAELAAAELVMPATAALGLELRLCARHDLEVERGLELAAEAMLRPEPEQSWVATPAARTGILS